jgi:hypothetical protein
VGYFLLFVKVTFAAFFTVGFSRFDDHFDGAGDQSV